MRKLKLAGLGLFGGFCSAALGIGGGVIMVPVLVLPLGYRMKMAVGTSLATIVPTALVANLLHLLIEPGNFRWTVVLFTLLGSIFGARFGASIVKRINSNLLRKLFAVLLIFAGLKMTNIIRIPTETVSNIGFLPLLVILGLIAGSSSALFGIGGGVIMVPILNLFFGLSMHEAIPTSLAIILPTTTAGALFHQKFDNIDRDALKYLIPLALFGAVLGAFFANAMPAQTLKMMFGILLILSSGKIFQQKEVNE